MKRGNALKQRIVAAGRSAIERGRRHRVLAAALLAIPLLGVSLGPILARQIFSSGPLSSREHESADLVRKRAEWFFKPRASVNGHVPNGLRLKALEQHDQMIREQGTFLDRFSASLANINPSSTQWTPLGPQPLANQFFFGNTSGRVTALAVDACDGTGNTVYLGAAEGGVWKTTNGGQNWTPLTDQQPSLATGSLALDPGCSGTRTSAIYAGTGEDDFAIDNVYGAGILKSTDGGATWTRDLTFTNPNFVGRLASGPFIGALAIDPNQTTTILAGVDGFGSNVTPSSVYRSTDSGVNWSAVGNAGVATDVLFDPNAAAGTAFAALGNPFGAPAVNGVYKSTDDGVTWNLLTGLINIAPNTSLGRISLAVAPKGAPRALYAAIADANSISSNLLGVFRSTDGGTTWAKLTGVPGFCNPQCFYDMRFAVAPTGNGILLFAGGAAHATGSSAGQIAPTLIRSTDGGNSWGDVSLDGSGKQLHVDHHALAFTTDGSKMYVGNDGGAWSSTDVLNTGVAAGSQHWTNLNSTLNITQFYPGNSIHPTTDQIVYAGSQDNGTEQFSGTLDWSDTEACGDGGFTAIDSQTPSTIYAGCAFFGNIGTLNRNTLNGVPGPNGNNWVPIDNNNGINLNDNGSFIPPFVLDTKSSLNLYFGTFRVYQTQNGGGFWRTISGDLTSGNISTNFITAISVAPGDSNTVYAGTSNALIWTSSNALSASPMFTMTSIANLPVIRQVSAIAVDPVNAKAAFATFSGFSCPGHAACDGRGHNFFTNNSGAAWTNVDGNLPDIPVNDIVIDPIDPTDNTVYIATDAGVFGSTNATAGAATLWTPLATALPKVVVVSLKLRNASRTLVAGTHGRGAWNLLVPAVPPFSLSSLSPTSVNSGSAAFPLTATGSGFTSTSVINFNGTNLTTTSSTLPTSITATVPASAVATGGSVPVKVTNTATSQSTNSLQFSIIGNTDFAFGAASPTQLTTTAGTPTSFTVPVSSVGASSGSPVNLSCGVSPPQATILCTFIPPSPVTPVSTGTSVTVTVNTVLRTGLPIARVNRWAPPAARGVWLAFGALLTMGLFILMIRFAGRRRLGIGLTCAVMMAGLLGVIAGCGGGGGGVVHGGTPAGTYTITVSGQSGNFQHSASGVTVKVN